MLTTSVKKSILTAIAGLSTSTSLSAGYYMGLSTTEPTAEGGNFTEPAADTGYARININSTSTSGPSFPFEWVDTNYSQVWNKYEIHFNVAKATWGTIGWVGIFSNSGSLLAYGHLVDEDGAETTITITEGHIPTILQHQAKISIDVQ